MLFCPNDNAFRFRAGKKSGSGSKPQAVDVKLKKIKKGNKGGSDAKAAAIDSLVRSAVEV